MSTRLALGASLLLGSAGAALGGSLTEDLAAAAREGTTTLAFRYRIETVDEDAFERDAFASTLRSRLGYATRPLHGWSLAVEVDDVRHLGSDRYADTRNGVTDRPQVVDPEGTDLNVAMLRYTGGTGTELRLGRQRIERVNQRFVGGVGWRQNEQTYDAISLTRAFGKEAHASLAWVGQVNRIHGPDDGIPPADLDSNSQLLDLDWTPDPRIALNAYACLMDFDNADALSNRTLGLRATGSQSLGGEWKLGYAAEFARQADHGDNPVDYAANYTLLEVSVGLPRLALRLGHEVLEGDSTAGRAFRTPLASLHLFQGWADKFLTTPNAGVEDLYVAVNGKLIGADWLLRLHDFRAEAGDGDWGREIDASASWPIGKHYTVLLKAASFDAEDLATDTTKLWLMATASF